jgi:hypothetical protein
MENSELEGERQKVMHQQEAVVIDAKDNSPSPVLLQIRWKQARQLEEKIPSMFRNLQTRNVLMHFSCIMATSISSRMFTIAEEHSILEVTGWFLLQVHWLSMPPPPGGPSMTMPIRQLEIRVYYRRRPH